MLNILAIVVLWTGLTIAATAQGDVPEAVMEPYRAYIEAFEADEIEEAAGHAEQAWRAGQAEQIDPELLAALAENRAQILSDAGNFQEAEAAFIDLADLQQSRGESVAIVEDARLRGAEAAFHGDDLRRAWRLSHEAMRATDPAATDPTERSVAFRAMQLRAMTDWRQGELRRGARTAADAIELSEELGISEPTADMAMMSFYAGIGNAMRDRYEDAAYWFSVSAGMMRALEVGRDERLVTSGWSDYARSRLDDEQGLALVRRLERSPVADLLEAEMDVDDDEDDARYDGPDSNDAYPTNRRPPAYPDGALNAGLEGVSLHMFDVDETGRPDNVRVIYSAPHPIFGERGVRAIERWRYEPARIDGEPVRREGVITSFNYYIDD